MACSIYILKMFVSLWSTYAIACIVYVNQLLMKQTLSNPTASTVYTYVHTDSQKIEIKKKTKTPRITDEGWNSQKQLSNPVEKKMKEGKRRKKRLLYLHPKLSPGLVLL